MPHYLAVDIASDNRIPPGKNARTSHQFALPTGCETGAVQARLLYRPIPLSLATERGWEAKDYVIVSGNQTW